MIEKYRNLKILHELCIPILFAIKTTSYLEKTAVWLIQLRNYGDNK